MTGQKKAVVDAVQVLLPNFNLYKDIALVMLTKDQLEDIKRNIGLRIISGDVEYSKDRTNNAEVMAYARSMVMNHLKKAKELNGNAVYGGGTAKPSPTAPKNHFPLNKELLTDELKDYVEEL
jgi:hypothetical protein